MLAGSVGLLVASRVAPSDVAAAVAGSCWAAVDSIEPALELGVAAGCSLAHSCLDSAWQLVEPDSGLEHQEAWSPHLHLAVDVAVSSSAAAAGQA